MSARAEGAPVGIAPSTPARLSLAEWRAAFGRPASDSSRTTAWVSRSRSPTARCSRSSRPSSSWSACSGSSTATTTCASFLAPIAPADVLTTIDRLQADSTGAAASLAVRARCGRRRLGRERRDGHGDQGRQPRLRARRDPAVLEDAADGDRARRADGPGHRRALPADRLRRPARHGDRRRRRPRRAPSSSLWAIVRWPLAFVAVLLFFALVYYLAPNRTVRRWEWISARSRGRRRSPGSRCRRSSRSTRRSRTRTRRRTARSRAGSSCCSGSTTRPFALLFGAELNSELDRQAEIRAAGGPNAGLTKPSRRPER